MTYKATSVLSAGFVLLLSSLSLAAPPAGVKRIADLQYVAGGGERQRLDLYVPEQTPAQRMPVVVWIHGGGWQKGSKGENGGPYPNLVGKGYAIACINYRYTTTAPMPAQLEDCKAAIRFLRKHADEYHLDSAHIAVFGHSAGGHLAAMVGLTGKEKKFDVGDNLDQSSAVQAVIEWSGPTNLLTLPPSEGRARLIGGPVADHQEQARAASPITYVHPGSPPFIITHSDTDKIVPFSQAEELRDALTKAGVEVIWHPLHNAQHWDKQLVSREMFEACLEFLDKHLKGAK